MWWSGTFRNMCTSPFSFLHNLRPLQSDANQISRKDGLGITLAATDALDNAPRNIIFRLRRLLLFKNLLASFRRDFMRGEFFVFQPPPLHFLFAFRNFLGNDLIQTPRDVAGKFGEDILEWWLWKYHRPFSFFHIFFSLTANEKTLFERYFFM